MIIKSSKHVFCTVNTCKNSNLSFCFLLYFFNNETWKSHSVLKVSTKFIDTLICSWWHKWIYKIAVRHMDLYCICSTFHCTFCCFTISFYKLIHFFCRYFFRNVSSICWCDCCSCLDRCSCILCISFRSCILKLDRYLCTFCMTGICDFLQTFNAVVIVKTWFLRTSLSSFMYYSRFNCDQTKLTFCTLTIVSHRFVTPCSVWICEIISHRWNHKTILNCHRSNLNRRKHIFEFHHFTSLFGIICFFKLVYQLWPNFF